MIKTRLNSVLLALAVSILTAHAQTPYVHVKSYWCKDVMEWSGGDTNARPVQTYEFLFDTAATEQLTTLDYTASPAEHVLIGPGLNTRTIEESWTWNGSTFSRSTWFDQLEAGANSISITNYEPTFELSPPPTNLIEFTEYSRANTKFSGGSSYRFIDPDPAHVCLESRPGKQIHSRSARTEIAVGLSSGDSQQVYSAKLTVHAYAATVCPGLQYTELHEINPGELSGAYYTPPFTMWGGSAGPRVLLPLKARIMIGNYPVKSDHTVTIPIRGSSSTILEPRIAVPTGVPVAAVFEITASDVASAGITVDTNGAVVAADLDLSGQNLTMNSLGTTGDVVIGGNATVTGNVNANALSGQKLNIYGAGVGTSSGNSVTNVIFQTSSVGNYGNIDFIDRRFSSGSDWTTVSTRIQKRVDYTGQGYLEFNPSGDPYGLALGSYSGEIMRLQNGGNVGIGKVPSSGVKLDVAGAGAFSGQVSAGSFSGGNVSGAYGTFTSGLSVSGSTSLAGVTSGAISGTTIQATTFTFSNGVTIKTGSGAPSSSQPNGSLYLRSDGGSGSTFYVRENGAWVAK